MKYTLVGLLIIGIAGCGGSDGSGEGKSPVGTNGPAVTQQSDSPSVVSPTSMDSDSPALHMQPDVSADASPEEVAAAVIHAWQAGDESGFKALLTPKAQVETGKLGFAMENLPPTMKFEIKSAEYVTEKKQAAHVRFAWSDTGANGETLTEQGFWLLRNLQPIGWRVSGLANLVDAEANQFDIFNFEDAEELAKKLDLPTDQDGHPRHANSAPDGTLQR